MKLNIDTLVNLFIAYIVINLLTMPLSPYGFGNGLMTKAQYAPIMATKLVLIAMFVIGFVYFGVSELVKRYRKFPR